MKLDIDIIKSPIDKHLDEFDKQFKDSMKSSVPLLDIITRYIVKRKGKKFARCLFSFRPNMCGGIKDSTYRAATLIELLHTATLVHDDIVDDSNERRGFFSINALWKNKIACLLAIFFYQEECLSR